MLAKRIIPCLDVTAGRVVKGVNFVNLRDAGDPVELAERYNDQGADELVFLDITASSDARATHIPIIASGGAGTLEHFSQVLTEGLADAALAASIFHYGTYTVSDLKNHLASCGVPVRPAL